MTDPHNVHPLAPEPGTREEGVGATDNDPETVRVRAGVELGAIRYVLWIGLALAILFMIGSYLFGYLPVADTARN
jgi:hypothetical protein